MQCRTDSAKTKINFKVDSLVLSSIYILHSTRLSELPKELAAMAQESNQRLRNRAFWKHPQKLLMVGRLLSRHMPRSQVNAQTPWTESGSLITNKLCKRLPSTALYTFEETNKAHYQTIWTRTKQFSSLCNLCLRWSASIWFATGVVLLAQCQVQSFLLIHTRIFPTFIVCSSTNTAFPSFQTVQSCSISRHAKHYDTTEAADCRIIWEKSVPKFCCDSHCFDPVCNCNGIHNQGYKYTQSSK